MIDKPTKAINYSIRQASQGDLEAVLALNESVVPHVNSLVLADMQDFLKKAVYFRLVCDEEDHPRAFLIGLAPDTDYDSPNFRWFCDHYEQFAYIDRIAVAESARRRGIAEALYDDFAGATRDWAQRMSCEVNLRPANPGSLEFHKRLGFKQVGSQEIHNGAKKVALMVKELG